VIDDGIKPYPKTKDSGLSWLGGVPEHWDVTPISRIGQLFKGNGGNKDDEVPSGVPCVRYGDLYTRHEFFIRSARACVPPNLVSAYTPIRYGDLLFAASGETFEDIGRSAVNLIQEEACCGGDVLLLRPKQPVNPRFLAYAADATPSRNQKASMGRGFTVVHIYASQLKRLTLALPPLPEQAAIVHFLDHEDRRIRRYVRAKQKLIMLLEEQKQAIIHRAVTRGLNPDVRLKPSGVEWLGDVPEHWEIRRNGRLFTQRNDTGFADLPILEVSLRTGVRVRDFENSDRKQVLMDREKYKRAAAGDIAYNMMRMWQGAVGVAPTDGTVSPAYVVARPLAGTESRYFAYLFRTRTYMGEVDRCSRGIVKDRNRLYWEDFKQIPSCYPPFREQVAIADAIDEGSEAIKIGVDQVRRQIALLGEFRTRLIADVVTGKLDVRDAAARLPDEPKEPEPLDETEALDEADEDSDNGADAAPEEAEA
jgi:type I restriction enzyme S subunit